MLALLQFVLEKIDFLALATAAREHKNRLTAARLCKLVVTAYDIVDLYEVILDELTEALRRSDGSGGKFHFQLNPARIRHLLNEQALNLEFMEKLLYELLDEVRLIDPRFAEAFTAFFPGKWGILTSLQFLLAEGKLPLSDRGAEEFPRSSDGTERSLWFTNEPPSEQELTSRAELWSINRTQNIVEVNYYDGMMFFDELQRYLEAVKPAEELRALRAAADSYRTALKDNFSLADILAEIDSVKKHSSWVNN